MQHAQGDVKGAYKKLSLKTWKLEVRFESQAHLGGCEACWLILMNRMSRCGVSWSIPRC